MFKQTLAAIITWVGLNSAAAAQATAPQTAPRTCTLPKIADEVALKQIPATDLMTVPVEINGATKQFLLDLGTKASTVSQAAVTGLSLPETPKLGVNFGGLLNIPVYDVNSGLGSGALLTRVRLGSFAIGGATTHHMQLLVSNDKDMGQSEPYDGLLTGDFFRQYDVELDFAAKRMTYLTPTDCTDPNRVVFWPHSDVAMIPATLADDGRLQAQVMVQGHIINAEFDTSAARTIMRRDIAELYVGLKADTPDMVSEGDLKDGASMQVYSHTFPQITFAGGVTAVNVPVLIQDYTTTHIDRQPVLGSRAQFRDTRIPDLAIGMDVLRHLHMYVVPGQGRVYVTSAEAAGRPEAPAL